MKLNKIELVKEGEYWTLYVDGIQCGCGYFSDVIDVIVEFKTTEDAENYARQTTGRTWMYSDVTEFMTGRNE